MTTRKVRELDEDTIRQIAAGEVVERPASVVKELIENAIDAESRKITLETLDGGRKSIRVSDDGHGMSAEDALLSLKRHTTSKIRSASDLEDLKSFGFRGEALPSIASVSNMTLLTRSQNEPHGIEISMSGGAILSKKECGRATGTTVEVKDLFFNTPARLKFMKSESSEKSKILRTFEEIAIAHPGISFETKGDQRKTFELPARDALLDRIADLWGEEFSAESMIPLSYQHPYVRIEGWVSNPQSHRPTKNYQIFYVNHRPIQSRSLTHALYEAYRDCLPVGRHPSAVVFVTLEPSLVDVNVHPSKREVRFRNEPQIHDALLKEIRSKRARISEAPKVFSPQFAGRTAALDLEVPREPLSSTVRESGQGGYSVPTHTVHASHASSEQNRPETGVLFQEKPRVLAQFNRLYVIAEQGDNLVIVDQHAAGERILYERFRKAVHSQENVPTQTLLIPLLWNVTPSQSEILRSNRQAFQRLGFAIEEFGEKTFRITEAPSFIPEPELKSILDESLSALENQGSPSLAAEEKIMHSACRAAIKANDHLSHKELSELLAQLSECANPHTCPHGRPVTLIISRRELDKKFGRT